MKKTFILSLSILTLGWLTANAKIHVKPKKLKAKALQKNCYGGAGTCGATYMFCVDATLTSAEQLNIWDAFEAQYCGTGNK